MDKFEKLLEEVKPNADDLKNGWKLSCDFLRKVKNNIDQKDGVLSLEDIELTILALMKWDGVRVFWDDVSNLLTDVSDLFTLVNDLKHENARLKNACIEALSLMNYEKEFEYDLCLGDGEMNIVRFLRVKRELSEALGIGVME